MREGVKPYGLKEFHDKRTLIVPISNAAGEPVNLQFIAEDGTKRFKTGGAVAGCAKGKIERRLRSGKRMTTSATRERLIDELIRVEDAREAAFIAAARRLLGWQ